jgi:hypothetical protein
MFRLKLRACCSPLDFNPVSDDAAPFHFCSHQLMLLLLLRPLAQLYSAPSSS